MENTQQNISDFYKKISDDIKNKKISTEQLISLSKFMLKYKFEENYKEDDEIIKYLVMGWFVYNSKK
tara:strand:+ start:2420 stop:2620 length:201 start_codon:yes stop_codon:yes gene_type:complete